MYTIVKHLRGNSNWLQFLIKINKKNVGPFCFSISFWTNIDYVKNAPTAIEYRQNSNKTILWRSIEIISVVLTILSKNTTTFFNSHSNSNQKFILKNYLHADPADETTAESTYTSITSNGIETSCGAVVAIDRIGDLREAENDVNEVNVQLSIAQCVSYLKFTKNSTLFERIYIQLKF